MQYVLTKAEQEAEVKRAEAKGISSSQNIIAGSLTPEYLEWKYIDVINVLAKAHNDTVVIAPYDPRLLPTLPEGKKYDTKVVPIAPKIPVKVDGKN
jgi:prohibitin 1